MFVKTVFEKGSSNMYAFVRGSLHIAELDYREKCNTERLGHLVKYKMRGYWFSSTLSTKGGLSVGTAYFSFNEENAHMDGLSTYKNLSEKEVLKFGSTKTKLNGKNFKTHVDSIFGNGTVYSGIRDDDSFRNLVEAWFAFPNAPDGTYGWMKRARN